MAKRLRQTVLLLAAAATLAVPATAAAHTAAIRGGHVVVDGKPFFPIMQWLQCPWLFPQNAALGVNVFLGKGCGGTSDADELAAAESAHAFSVLPATGVASGSSLLGWHFADEPDMNGIRPAVIAAQYRENRRRNPTLLNFLTVTEGFAATQRPPSWMHGSRAPYEAYARATDLIGTDVYPIYGWCRPDWIARVADVQRQLVRIAHGRPTFQWIEAASTSSQFCSGRGVKPTELRAEVWMAVTNGATAIGYFTHSWTGGYSQFRVAPDVQAEIRRTNAQLTRLTPAILGTPVALRTTVSGGRVDAIARRTGGKLYVFAVNVGRTTATASFAPRGLGSRRVMVVDESRTLATASGTFKDAFGPLGVHLYVAGE